MFSRLIRSLFGTSNDRFLKKYRRRIPAINAMEDSIQLLSDDQLASKTDEFRNRLAEGEDLNSLLPDAFAVTREASRRVLGLRHFDVQLIGGIVLHEGRIAEMRTGEGKTLAATLPVYLNALTGKGVHVVTVNDYLAQRDAADMGKIYKFLGLTTGVIISNMDENSRKAAYNADITYGTNNEFGFDYLRDNMKYRLEDMVQRPFHYAIVDEVDSILIDEARTPLIISGPAEDSSELYRKADAVIAQLAKMPQYYDKDEKFRTVTLTEQGTEEIEKRLFEAGILRGGNLYDVQNVAVVHHVQQSLRAHTLFQRDVEYIVRNNEVVIIDEFTGRMMDDRRYSEGLHQALEAKEHVEIQKENQTLASITFQNYFRLYPKLSGMTGTAMTESDEFAEIYKLSVVEIPTNQPVVRLDEDDEVYLTIQEKFNAVINLIENINKKGQPILVGTTSIEKSEYLSEQLKKRKIKHNVLNARFHEMEASIIAQAGVPGAITIATNMAGRGTDIKLGGNVGMRIQQEIAAIKDPEELARSEEAIRADVNTKHEVAKKAGGLFVIGTERHESRRIDNQLRGRSGRQGDPGNSRFFLSLEDDLMRIFGSDRMSGMLQKLGLKKGESITHPWINKALEKAQKKVEARNFDMRKNTLKYDDVMNDQRKEVYAQRREYMTMDDVSDIITSLRSSFLDDLVARHVPEKSFPEQWSIPALADSLKSHFNLELPLAKWAGEDGVDYTVMRERIGEKVETLMLNKAEKFGKDVYDLVQKQLLLTTFDAVWKEHLLYLDQLRQGIGLRAYGQKDPLNEYKQEAFNLFTYMLDEARERVTSLMARFEVAPQPLEEQDFASMTALGPTLGSDMDIVSHLAGVEANPAFSAAHPSSPGDIVSAEARRPSRNALCPCKSGKKFKYCHGRIV